MATRYMISDDNGVRWSDDGYDALETGRAIMSAVDNGLKEQYVHHIGAQWTGDLVLAQEICRTC